MPTYDYRCGHCSHEFEVFQSITESTKRKCPECGRLKLERVIGPGAGILFKGSGFYETDYRSDAYKKAAEKERSAGDGASSGGKGDAKKGSDSKSTPKSDGDKD